MNKDGSCYLDLIENTIKDIRVFNQTNAIVIKSTVIPGTTKRLNNEYKLISFMPEFLTEANALNDFINLERHFMSCNGYTNTQKIVALFDNLKIAEIIQGDISLCIDPTTLELVKYTRNCYLATRLSFFNEIKQICDAFKVDYNSMVDMVGEDKRIGKHYNSIGDNPGWGLSCLPKDINGLMALQKELGLKSEVLIGAWNKNLEVRKIKDWELMEKAVKK